MAATTNSSFVASPAAASSGAAAYPRHLAADLSGGLAPLYRELVLSKRSEELEEHRQPCKEETTTTTSVSPRIPVELVEFCRDLLLVVEKQEEEAPPPRAALPPQEH